jgi:hypothetical protein
MEEYPQGLLKGCKDTKTIHLPLLDALMLFWMLIVAVMRVKEHRIGAL